MHDTSIHFDLLSYPSSILNTLSVLEYGLVLPDVEKHRLELFSSIQIHSFTKPKRLLTLNILQLDTQYSFSSQIHI